jgi:hypothetical protein
LLKLKRQNQGSFKRPSGFNWWFFTRKIQTKIGIIALPVQLPGFTPRLDNIPKDRNVWPPHWKQLQKKRAMGIEPTYSAWKADALPLSYTRNTINYLHL